MWSVTHWLVVLVVLASAREVSAGSVHSRESGRPPYWCVEIKLDAFIKALEGRASGNPAASTLDQLNQQHSPISVGGGCIWNVHFTKSREIRDAKLIKPKSNPEEVEIYGHRCSELRKGTVLKGILTTHDTEQSSEADLGTLRNKIILFRECKCSMERNAASDIPDRCVSWKK